MEGTMSSKDLFKHASSDDLIKSDQNSSQYKSAGINRSLQHLIIFISIAAIVVFVIVSLKSNDSQQPSDQATESQAQVDYNENISNLLSNFVNYYNQCDIKEMKTLFRRDFDTSFIDYMRYECARTGAPYSSTISLADNSYTILSNSPEKMEIWVSVFETIHSKHSKEADSAKDTLSFIINKAHQYKIEKVTGLSRQEY